MLLHFFAGVWLDIICDDVGAVYLLVLGVKKPKRLEHVVYELEMVASSFLCQFFFLQNMRQLMM